MSPETEPVIRVPLEAAPAPATVPPCPNCGAPLGAAFCARCGQRGGSPLESTAAFLSEALHDLTSLDSRFVRSLRTLFLRPGTLTLEYVSGRRARYTQPVQLYLLAAAAFFLVASVRPFLWLNPATRQVGGALPGMTVTNRLPAETLARLERTGTSLELFGERFTDAVNGYLPAFLVGSVVLFSLVVYALHRRRERRYLAHAVFALHWAAFYLTIMAVFRLFPVQWRLQDVSMGLAWLWLALALRRLHHLRLPGAIARAFLLLLAFLFILLLWVQSAIRIGLLVA